MTKIYIKITPDNKVSVIKEPYCMSDQLRTMQKEVGGRIETIRTKNDLVIICNAEGYILELPINKVASMICDVPVHGSVLLVVSEMMDDGEKALTGFEVGDA